MRSIYTILLCVASTTVAAQFTPAEVTLSNSELSVMVSVAGTIQTEGKAAVGVSFPGQHEVQVEMEDVAPGIYLLLVGIWDGITTKRVIKR